MFHFVVGSYRFNKNKHEKVSVHNLDGLRSSCSCAFLPFIFWNIANQLGRYNATEPKLSLKTVHVPTNTEVFLHRLWLCGKSGF